jgi:hypothetical protein
VDSGDQKNVVGEEKNVQILTNFKMEMKSSTLSIFFSFKRNWKPSAKTEAQFFEKAQIFFNFFFCENLFFYLFSVFYVS